MLFFNAMFFLAMIFPSPVQDSQSLEWNKKSTLTAEHQVEFPGLVLEPGVYIVSLRENGPKRSVVDILSEDESQVLASLVAVPDHRMRPDDSSEFTFHQVKGDGPVPVQTWFYPGDLVGLEFVYSKPRAKEIAKDSDDYVMASNGSKDSAIVAVTPNGKEIVIDGQVSQAARQKRQ